MKAAVLAAGIGSRLGELTTETAKPALDVAGTPMVARVVENLARRGFDQIAVNLHYHAEQVRAALGSGPALSRIVYFPERELLGTAGALAPMRGFLSDVDAFVVHYGDVLTDHDVGAMLETHLRRGALLTLLVHRRHGSNSVVTVDEDWRVVGFLERPSERDRAVTTSPWVNSGVYACSREVLDLIPAVAPSDLARDVVPLAVAAGRTYAESLAGYRWAIDSRERLEEARRSLSVETDR